MCSCSTKRKLPIGNPSSVIFAPSRLFLFNFSLQTIMYSTKFIHIAGKIIQNLKKIFGSREESEVVGFFVFSHTDNGLG